MTGALVPVDGGVVLGLSFALTAPAALPAKVGVHLLTDVGHMPHMEAASEVNRLIANLAVG